MKRFTLRDPKTLSAALGWVGAIIILLAYFLVSFGVMQANQVSWQLLNLFGSSGIVISALPKKDWPALWLNVIFGIIAAVAILRLAVVL